MTPKQNEPVAWKWHQAPVKTSWGDGMVVADLAIDKDHTVSIYCERDQTAKVEAMFTPLQQEAKDEPVDVTEIAFEAWWLRSGQFLRAGGGDYEKTFAYHAWLESLACTTPPQRKPLMDEEIWKFWWARPAVPDGEDDSMEAQFVAAVRAIEAAHGIKGEA